MAMRNVSDKNDKYHVEERTSFLFSAESVLCFFQNLLDMRFEAFCMWP